MGLFFGLKVAKKLLGGGSAPQKKRERMSPDHIQQTNRCDNCGGQLFRSRSKRSQMICSNCEDRKILY